MKILIIPDKFKGSLNSKEVCDAIEKGIRRFLPKSEITKIPLADGGEGSLAVLEKTIGFERIHLEVRNPLFKTIPAYYGITDNAAYIEMASASGLQLLCKDEHNPMFTSSFGTGEMIADAIKRGATKVYLFVGGSATNDAGIGIASALGYQFLDERNKVLEPTGTNLLKIKSIDSSNVISIENINFNVLTDVKNPLFGIDGAAYSYAEQKGANQEEIEILNSGLQNVSQIIEKTFGVDVSQIPGSGAAGGVGAGMVAFCNANIFNGIDSIMDLLNVNYHIQQSDLVITGEGLLDKQTLKGKLVKGVVDRCKKMNKPLGIVCGDIDLSEEELKYFYPSQIKTIKVDGISKEDAMKNAYTLLIHRAEELIREFINRS